MYLQAENQEHQPGARPEGQVGDPPGRPLADHQEDREGIRLGVPRGALLAGQVVHHQGVLEGMVLDPHQGQVLSQGGLLFQCLVLFQLGWVVWVLCLCCLHLGCLGLFLAAQQGVVCWSHQPLHNI